MSAPAARRIDDSALAGAVIGVVAAGLGLLASTPNFLLAAIGIGVIVWLGLAGEAALLSLVLATSGVSLAFLSEGALPLGGRIDGLRLAMVLGGFLVLAIRRPGLLHPLRDVAFYLAFLLFAALTLAWSPSRVDGLRFLAKLVYPVVAYLLALHLLRAEGERRLFRYLCIGVVLSLALNVGVALSGLSPYGGGGYANRFAGASHPNSIGLFCAFTGLALYAAWRRWRRPLYAGLLVVTALQLVATGSRTALVSAGVGFLAFELVERRWRQAAVATLLAASVWLLVPTFGERTSGASEDAGLSVLQIGSGLNFSGRLALWADAWSSLMGDSQALGRGVGTTDLFFSTRYAGLRSVHNGFLLLLIDVGLVGLGLALVFYGAKLAEIAAAALRSSRDRPYLGLGVALLVAYLAASLMESTFGGYASPSSVLWIGLALAAWSAEIEAGRTAATA